MIARRPSPRFHRGRVTDQLIVTPLTILGGSAGGVLQWCRSDLGITLNGSTVSAWADQSGNANDYSQGTASKQPTYSASGGANGTPYLDFDGTDDELVDAGFNLPAPGTTPTYIWMIVYQDTWTANDCVIGTDTGTVNAFSLLQNTASPQLGMANPTGGGNNSALAVDVWGRIELGWTNSTADFIKCIATNVTGTNHGNNASTGRRIAKASTTGAGFADMFIAEILHVNRIPSASERASLDSYCTSRYGVGLV